MTELIERAVKQRARKLDTTISIDFSAIGGRLTPDGEVAVLGFVHHYLGLWSARVAEGKASRRPRRPEMVYEYVPEHLTMPVIRAEAPEVANVLRSILSKPNMLAPATEESA